MTNDIDCKQVLRVVLFLFCHIFYCRHLEGNPIKTSDFPFFKMSITSSLMLPIKENVYLEFTN